MPSINIVSVLLPRGTIRQPPPAPSAGFAQVKCRDFVLLLCDFRITHVQLSAVTLHWSLDLPLSAPWNSAKPVWKVWSSNFVTISLYKWGDCTSSLSEINFATGPHLHELRIKLLRCVTTGFEDSSKGGESSIVGSNILISAAYMLFPPPQV